MSTRRQFLAGLGAATAVVAAGAAARLTAGGHVPSCWWGIYTNDNLPVGGGSPDYWTYVDMLESKLGRGFAGWRRNGITGADDLSVYRKCYDRGWHWSYANGTQRGSDDVIDGFWADTARGVYDQFYDRFFRTISADPRWTTANPFHFSFHHEQYVVAEGGGPAAGSATDYGAAFRHVRGRMDAVGAHVSQGGNMLMCFVPHWRQFFGDPVFGSWRPTAAVAPFVVSRVDPGADSYDKVGADIYLPAGETLSASAQWSPVRSFALDRGKSFFAGEAGVAGDDATVVAYLRELDDQLKRWGAGTGAGRVEAICWTSRVTSLGDLRLDATPARLAGYTTMANDSFYAGTA